MSLPTPYANSKYTVNEYQAANHVSSRDMIRTPQTEWREEPCGSAKLPNVQSTKIFLGMEFVLLTQLILVFMIHVTRCC